MRKTISVLAFGLIGLTTLGACAVPLAEVMEVNAEAEAAEAPRRAVAQQAFLEQCHIAITGDRINRKARVSAGFVGAASDPRAAKFVAPLSVGTNVIGNEFNLTFEGAINDRDFVPTARAGGRTAAPVPDCSTLGMAFDIAPRFFAAKGFKITQEFMGQTRSSTLSI